MSGSATTTRAKPRTRSPRAVARTLAIAGLAGVALVVIRAAASRIAARRCPADGFDHAEAGAWLEPADGMPAWMTDPSVGTSPVTWEDRVARDAAPAPRDRLEQRVRDALLAAGYTEDDLEYHPAADAGDA